MLPVVSLILLALAVSLDGFGVGITYGLRRIRIPLMSIAIISGCSGLIFWVAMQLGSYLSQFLSPRLATVIGALILIAVGLWALMQMFRNKGADEPSETSASKQSEVNEELAPLGDAPAASADLRTVIVIEWKQLGLVIQILRKPSLADVDQSGVISSSEAVLLGIALSLDAFGAGIGAAFLGFSSFLTAFVIACSSGFFIATGLRLGIFYANRSWMKKLSFLPGFLLIVMGLMKLL
ncbi:sporulation membrane protein YtaF [Paenibacillus koleovorans]|uniref:sporulation membrane protein YtaF n=1 Tax=Paenibacillus koleovorans TaxID=121608 RepID=UPI000FDA42D8|nr:sporulation membrane protein YtaF [Paenibacillus koleovorans]